MKISLLLAVVAAMVMGADGAPPQTRKPGRAPATGPVVGSGERDYGTCESCRNCHPRAYDQHVASMHSLSFSNPVFQAQYALDVLPLAASGGDLSHLARSCATCHAPIAHQSSRARLVRLEDVNATSARIACDFCHTITGYTGAEPGSGNYLTEPGPSKYGPLLTRGDWHHKVLAAADAERVLCHLSRGGQRPGARHQGHLLRVEGEPLRGRGRAVPGLPHERERLSHPGPAGA